MRSRTRKGFTLVELLIVVVVIGILAAIVQTQFKTSKSKAFTASMRSDLHNMETAQESYFYDHRRYASDPDSLTLTHSPGVQLVIVSADSTGWSATSNHPMAWPLTCAIFVGNAAPLGAATSEGVIACQ